MPVRRRFVQRLIGRPRLSLSTYFQGGAQLCTPLLRRGLTDCNIWIGSGLGPCADRGERNE